MNYIELVNNFWAKDIEYNFSDKEIALYFYLLKVSNSISWRNPFGLSSSMTVAKFGWGKHSFDTAKNRLKLAGLITFRPGDGRGNVYQYEIAGLEKDNKKESKKGAQKQPLSGTLFDTLSGTLSGQKPETSLNININKTENLKPPAPLKGEEGEDVPEKTWRDDFEVYLTDLRNAYRATAIDTAYITERAKYHPGLNIRLSLEKACKEFWATPAGWKHKKKSKSSDLNWKSTFTKALDQKCNHVWLQKGETNETGEQKKISYI